MSTYRKSTGNFAAKIIIIPTTYMALCVKL